MRLSIVLPCYNEEETIEKTVRAVNAWLISSHDGEIIVVNDGSEDRSLMVLQKLEQEIDRLHIVNRAKNGGYGMAVRDGCDSAREEWIAFMDSDGQFDPADIDRLIEKRDGYEFITGRRRRRADPLLRNIFGKVLGIANLVVLGIWVRDVNCGMKLFTRGVWKKVRPTLGVEKLFNASVFLNLKNEGIPWTQVDVPHYPRLAGTPTGGSVKMIFQTFKELWELRKSPR